ncbi:MAG: hypothetical protein CVU06_06875, partial [Bacteroidetes bacterium HGW-Bacteroidetes-22]
MKALLLIDCITNTSEIIISVINQRAPLSTHYKPEHNGETFMKNIIIKSRITGIIFFTVFVNIMSLNASNDSLRNAFSKEKEPGNKLRL